MKKCTGLFFILLLIGFTFVSCDSSGSDDGDNNGNDGSVVAVTGIQINKGSTTLLTGNTEQLFASVVPSNATNQGISWQSNYASIATVSDEGVVTGIAEGTAVIMATSDEGGYTAQCEVTVSSGPVAVTGVTLSEESLSLDAGDEVQLEASVEPSDATNQNLVWQSSVEDVAFVSAGGIVAGRSGGTATITVITVDGGYQAQCEVTVSEDYIPVEGVTLNRESTSLLLGESETLFATVSPLNATNQEVTWQSSDEGVAGVSSEGLVMAVSEGTAIISVFTDDGDFEAQCEVTVSILEIPVNGVTLNKETVTVYTGHTEQLTAWVHPSTATNQQVTWESGDEAVATVSEDGLVTAVTEGTAIITVTTDDGGYQDQCEVTVIQEPAPVAGVGIKSSIVLVPGDTEQVKAVVYPSNAGNTGLAWESDNPAVASVTSEGLVVAVSEGSTKIRAITQEGEYSSECIVTVSPYKIVTAGPGGLKIFNVSDPVNPAIAGESYQLLYVKDVVVSGSYAYVADGQEGFVVIDISDPANVFIVGSVATDGYGWAVSISGSYAYLASNNSEIVVIDISTPSSPEIVATCATSGVAKDIQIAGNYAYAADSGSGVAIIDISNPLTPSLITEYMPNTWGGSTSHIDIKGKYAVINTSWSRFDIIDISDPANPVDVVNFEVGSSAGGIVVKDDYAYIIDDFYGRLYIVNISDPSAPVIESSTGEPEDSLGVSVSGTHAFVADGINGLMILDVSDPANPVYEGGYNVSTDVHGGAVNGDYLYIADGQYGLVICDNSDPVSPVPVGRLNIESWISDVYAVDNYAYILDQWDFSLRAVNVADPSNPVLAGRCAISGDVLGMCVDGNYAYVLTFNGFVIIDISDPLNLTLTGSYESTSISINTGSDISAEGNYACINSSSELLIFNVTNKTSPALAGSIDDTYFIENVYVRDSYVYCAAGNDGLTIYDISNPASPVLAGSNDASGFAENIILDGNYAYLSGSYSLAILNISNPSSPVLTSVYVNGFSYIHESLFGLDGYIYSFNRTDGVVVYNVSDPLSTQIIFNEGEYDGISQ